jgi:hypothetical protein
VAVGAPSFAGGDPCRARGVVHRRLQTEKVGRVRTCRIRPAGLSTVDWTVDWIDNLAKLL